MRQRGRQKGTLRKEGPSWRGYWNEWVRSLTGVETWQKMSMLIAPATVPKKEAQRIFEDLVLNKLEAHNANYKALCTLDEFIKAKVTPLLKMKRAKGEEHYDNMLRNHVLPALGKMQMRAITPDHVQKLINQKLIDEKLSPQTVYHIRNTIRMVFNKAMKLGYYSELHPPTFGVEMPELTRVRERIALSAPQAQMLIDSLPSPAQEMVITLILTGMRIGELCGLKWKRVNLTDTTLWIDGEPLPPMTIAIREQFVSITKKYRREETTGGQWQKALKKRSAKRNIPIHPIVAGILSRFTNTGLEDPVFQGKKKGHPIDRKNVMRRKVKPVLEALSLPSIGWHDFRHTCSTWADTFGMTSADKQKAFGWADASMSLHYSHEDLERMRAVMGRMGGLLTLPERKAS